MALRTGGSRLTLLACGALSFIFSPLNFENIHILHRKQHRTKHQQQQTSHQNERELSERDREETYHSASLHAQHQRIRTQVARVGQRVLLPQLGQDVPRASYVIVVQHKVALEEDMDAPR